MYKVTVLICVLIGSTIAILNYINSKDQKPNVEAIELQNQLDYVISKKNTLMLIILEQRKKKPNKDLLDSLDVSYYLD
jgi:hypothetical protein